MAATTPGTSSSQRGWETSGLHEVFFLPCSTARGISVTRPGMEPMPLNWEHGILTTGPPEKSWGLVNTIFNNLVDNEMQC